MVNMLSNIYQNAEMINQKKLKKSCPHTMVYLYYHILNGLWRNFLHETNGFYSENVYYQDTDLAYLHADHYKKLKEATMLEKI